MSSEGTRPAGAPTEQAASKVVPTGQMAGDETPAGQRPPGMHQGDELPADAPGAGEHICRVCGGGKTAGGGTCPSCGGTGKVIESVAGGP